MRNLAQYPVTKDEILDYLKEQSQVQAKSLVIGDISGPVVMVLQSVIEKMTEDEIKGLQK